MSKAFCIAMILLAGPFWGVAQTTVPAEPTSPEPTSQPASASTTQPTTASAPALDPKLVAVLTKAARDGEMFDADAILASLIRATAAGENVDPAALAVLLKQETAYSLYDTIKADVTYTMNNRRLGTEEVRSGWVAYRKLDPDKQTPPGVRVTFEQLTVNKRTFKDRQDYAFDGYWFTIAKHKIKQLNRFQVAVKGQIVQPFRLGRSPFPLPFGQRAGDVLAMTTISTRQPRQSDPENTDYLLLTAKESAADSLNFVRMEIWLDRKLRLPVKIRSRDKAHNVNTAEFTKIMVNQELPKDAFRLADPGRGWKVNIQPMRRPSQTPSNARPTPSDR